MSGPSAGTSHDPEQSLTDYIHHLEKVQQRLMGARQGECCKIRIKWQNGNFLRAKFGSKQNSQLQKSCGMLFKCRTVADDPTIQLKSPHVSGVLLLCVAGKLEVLSNIHSFSLNRFTWPSA